MIIEKIVVRKIKITNLLYINCKNTEKHFNKIFSKRMIKIK